MTHEQLILKELLEIKRVQGEQGAEIRAIGSRMDSQEKRIGEVAETVGKLWDFHTTAKARIGILASISGGITGGIIWFAKAWWESHMMK